jgi:pimeloyl-ACP methyl ester carboxylesterase
MSTLRVEPAAARATPWDPAAGHRFVTADGTVLHVRDAGQRQPGDPTLVLVHGWTLDHTSWDRVVTALTTTVGRPIRVLRFDHRGHGGSAPAPAGTATVAQAADDLAELIADRVPDGPIVLVGHSMGGMAVMALAQRHPELVRARIAAVGLVATSSGGLSGATLGLPNRVAGLVRRIERRVNRRLARLRRPVLLPKPALARPGLRWLLFGTGPLRADVAATAEQVGRCHPASMVAFRQSIDEHERTDVLAGLRGLPVVLLAGSVDRLTPLAHARVIAGELADAEFVTYPRAGHMLPYERATEVAAHVATLIERTRATTPN